MAQVTPRFNSQKQDFFRTLKTRVDEYFTSNNISRHGNYRMLIKTLTLLSIYLVPYFLIVFGVFDSFAMLMVMSVVMGLGMAFIGLSVMHDANHGSYSSNKRLNTIMGYSLNFIGGHKSNWQIQHNDLHHTFTNVHGHDEDIAPIGLLRFSPHAEHKNVHRFQAVYAWFLYGLMTFMWVTTKDFKQLKRYKTQGLLKRKKLSYRKELTILLVAKALYYGYMLAVPIIFSPYSWWQVAIGFFTLHFVAGLTLALIFQPAHVVEETEFPLPDSSGNMENDWAIHQLYTTSNFARKNRVLSWFIGGLNHQVEHHLFPTVCHIHYRKLSEIVKKTAEEFNHPYLEQKTFVGAIVSHARTLIRLGKKPALQTI
jgi:linoleoyl-CoA desaturase